MLGRRAALAALAIVGLASCGNLFKSKVEAAPPSRNTHGVEVYLPTWYEPANYDRLNHLSQANKISKYIISFAVPDETGQLSLPHIKPAMQSLLDRSVNTKRSLAIGGQGGHQAGQVRRAWNKVLEDPDRFVKDVSASINTLKLASVDIDFEYPERNQAEKYTKLIAQMREELPRDVEITMAVPSNPNGEYAVGLQVNELNKYVNTYHVMAYDEAGPWSPVSDYAAPGTKTAQTANAWVAKVGNASKVSIGYPTYGYKFPGASTWQQPFRKQPSEAVTVRYGELAAATTWDIPEHLTSGAYGTDGVISFQSPAMIRRTADVVRQAHEAVAAPFLYDAKDLTDGHIAALADD